VGPTIGATVKLAATVIGKVVVFEQPDAFVTLYVMLQLPTAFGVTVADVVLATATEATAGFDDAQVPPAVPLVNVPVVPKQNDEEPLIEPKVGKLFTAKDCKTVVLQPAAEITVYLILVLPAETPVTLPVEETVATAAFCVLHVPPAVAQDN
jgi:hypothetical protein